VPPSKGSSTPCDPPDLGSADGVNAFLAQQAKKPIGDEHGSGLFVRNAKGWKYLRRALYKKICRMRLSLAGARRHIHDVVTSLHHQIGNWMVDNHRLVLQPSFEVGQMVSKINARTGNKRPLRRITVKLMLSLRHYDFKLYLLHKSRERAWCFVKIVCEVRVGVAEGETNMTLSLCSLGIHQQDLWQVRQDSHEARWPATLCVPQSHLRARGASGQRGSAQHPDPLHHRALL
jgi:hypothetical protein